jgi:Anti-sigma-K factor rskA
MNSDDVLRDYLEDGPNRGTRMPDGAVRVRALLGDPAVWDEPPAGVLDGVLAKIDAERRAGQGRGSAPVAAGPSDPRQLRAPTQGHPPPRQTPGRHAPGRDDNVRSLSEHRSTRRRLLAVAAAAVLFTGGGVGGWFAASELTQPTEPATTVVALEGGPVQPQASASVAWRQTGSGLAITLDPTGLPPAEPGTFYEAWLKSPDGDLVPIGTFHMRAGDDDKEPVELWSGVDAEDYPIMSVTIQTAGEGTESSKKVVLTGSLLVQR